MEAIMSTKPDNAIWPALPLNEWQDTYDTLHMWTQVVGHIRMVQSPPVNHYWHSTLYVTARGLTTSPTPYGNRTFEIDFDFIDHRLLVRYDDGVVDSIELKPQSVAVFYRSVFDALQSRGMQIKIHGKPDEVPDPIPFAEDDRHASYDREYASRFWRILVQSDRVFKQFRSSFIGKCSPVHFFWGSFDLAVTRFSGRAAPERPGADPITREAYSHEVISHGFWPGRESVSPPIFYSYTAPAPAGLENQPLRPAAALYSKELSEFILPYDAVRESNSPDDALISFMESTYEAGANLANWDRRALERG